MSIVNKHDLKSELGVEIVERTLEGLGYTMAHTKEKYSPYDLMVTKVTDEKSDLPDGGFPADVKTYTFTTKTKQVSITIKQYNNYCDIGDHYNRPFFLFIVDELHDGVFAINISESFPETSRFSSSESYLNGSLFKGSTNFWIYNDQSFIRIVLSQDLDLLNSISDQLNEF